MDGCYGTAYESDPSDDNDGEGAICKPAVRPGRQKVVCAFCGKYFRKDNLAGHVRSKHPSHSTSIGHANKRPRPSNGGSAIAAPKPSTIANFFNTEIEMVEMPRTADVSCQCTFDGTVVDGFNMETILKEIQRIPALVSSTAAASIASANKEVLGEDDDHIFVSLSLDAFLAEAGMLLDGDFIVCNLCQQHAHKSGIKGAQYSFSFGGFDEMGQLRRGVLSGLKQRALKHQRRRIHTWCLSYESDVAQAQKNKVNVGMAIGRLALRTICEAHSYLSFERACLDLHLDGVDIGKHHHTKDFPASMRGIWHDIVVEKTNQFYNTICPATGRFPCFATAADKVTESRSTGNVTTMTAFEHGVMKAQFVAAPVCRVYIAEGITGSHDGLSLAKNQLLGLKPYKLSAYAWSVQFTGNAYDGQYFLNNVPEYICELTGTAIEWILPGWDLSHRVCLVSKNCRNNDPAPSARLKDISWYGEIAPCISEQTIKFRYGKGYEELVDIAKEFDTIFRTPKLFCSTRMQQSEAKVLYNYCENFPLYITHYEDIQDATFGELNVLTDAVFVLRVHGMVDILQYIVREVSLPAQTVNISPWTLVHHCDCFYQRMCEVKSVLLDNACLNRADFYESEKFLKIIRPFFSYYTRAGFFDTVMTSMKIGNVKLFVAPGFKGVNKDVLADVWSYLGDFIDAFTTFFKLRILDDIPWQFRSMGKCVDLGKLCGSPCILPLSDQKLHLKKLYKWTKQYSKIPDLPTFASLWANHITISSRLVDYTSKYSWHF
jgi:hypothetical protein